MTRFDCSVFTVAMGAGEQVVRRCMSVGFNKKFTAETWGGVTKQALHQQLHHSEKVHDEVYSSKQRNSFNAMQAHMLGWF